MVRVGTEHGPELFVPAFADEVQVHFAQAGQEPVRVIHQGRRNAVVRNFQPVVGHLPGSRRRQRPHPDPVVLMLQRHPALGSDGGDFAGQRAERADGHGSVVVQVRTQHGVRLVVAAVGHGVQDVLRDGQRAAGSAQPVPARPRGRRRPRRMRRAVAVPDGGRGRGGLAGRGAPGLDGVGLWGCVHVARFLSVRRVLLQPEFFEDLAGGRRRHLDPGRAVADLVDDLVQGLVQPQRDVTADRRG